MRAQISLNGRWKFLPAFDEISADQRWLDAEFDPSNPQVVPKTGDIGWIGERFDDAGWMDMPVPSSWNSACEELWSYEGHGWYRRWVHVPAAWEGRRVEFASEGANYRTVVYVNGRYAGEHEGGYTPFAIPIHRFLRFGEQNLIAVACDNLPKPERVPGGQFAWWNHGGLYRDVALRSTEMIYIDDVTATTEGEDGRARVHLRVQVRCEEGHAVNRAVEVELYDPSGRAVPLPQSASAQMVHVDDGCAEVEMVLPVESPLLWSPEEPHLYTLRVRLRDTASGRPGDEWAHRIGLRTIRVEGTRLLLNGKPLRIKGVNRHELYPGRGMTHDEASLARDLDVVKWLGANAIRCHYPNHRRFYELCDERGILTMVEVPLWQWGRPLVQTDDMRALEAAKRQLEEIVRTYKNHPSVCIWSVSNENLVKPQSDDPEAVERARRTAEGNRELVALAKRLDPTRPVVEASNCWPGDPVHEVTDISAVNVYVGAPNPHVRGVPEIVRRMHERIGRLRAERPDKPILATEFGVWTVRGVTTDYFPGERYQAEKLAAMWKGLMEEPHVIGGFIWCFADYDVHRRFQWVYEYRVAYGLFDLHRRPKMAAYVMRELWTE